MITANEVKQKQQEHNSLIQVNEDLVKQVTHELMSNDEFVKGCDAVIDKSITKQVEQAVADDNNDTDYFYISMNDLADRGEFWLANDDFMVADGKTGRLLFKYLPPILKKLHVEHRQEWYRRETFTLRGKSHLFIRTLTFCKYDAYNEYDCSAVSKRKKYIYEQYSF